jgi:hypothetical protein
MIKDCPEMRKYEDVLKLLIAISHEDLGAIINIFFNFEK